MREKKEPSMNSKKIYLVLVTCSAVCIFYFFSELITVLSSNDLSIYPQENMLSDLCLWAGGTIFAFISTIYWGLKFQSARQ